MKWLWIILLLLVGFLYWYIAKENCCGPVDSITQRTTPAVVAPQSIATKKTPLVSFSCSDDAPKYSNRWGAYRDSISNNLKDNQYLEITGLDFTNEKNGSGESTLALARAKKIRGAFKKLTDDRIEVVHERKSGNCATGKDHEFIAIKTLTSDAKVIKETKDRSLIYFPTNSTNKLNDQEVETYLDDVAERVKQSGEKIALTGHTDDEGEPASNMILGQNRANVIKNYLISKGVSAAKITAISKGEESPVASNSNERGKAQNRRTELQIIK